MTKKNRSKDLGDTDLEASVLAENNEEEKLEDVDEKLVDSTQEQGLDEFEKLKSELEDFKKKYFYLLAESDNARKRFEREKENLIKYGNEKILTSLIEVLDNFDHSIHALKDEAEEKIQNIKEGMTMIQKQFLSKLEENGLSQIHAQGKEFDPKFHEAMCEQVCSDQKAGTVLSEFQKGYSLNGRLLRPSKVVVAKEQESKTNEE